MKNTFLTYRVLVIVLVLIFSSRQGCSENPPQFIFDGDELVFSQEEAIIDFGEVRQGEACAVAIVVKNSSGIILRIASVRSSCAMSVPSWPRKDIEPGGEGLIQVRYDSSRPGPFERLLTIHANTHTSETVLKMKGVILPE